MKTIDFIASYMREATIEEKMMIRDIVSPPKFTPPPIDPELIMRCLITSCHRLWLMSGRTNKLDVVKYIKDVTGWGLKDSKDWGDTNIFIN